MLTIFVLFVGLTLATAVIAYWSDNLGKKLGKKRVSLWGMRPRTTATFLTIASSWLIMVFTLGVMLAIFPPLRRSLLRYDDVVKSTTTLKGQVVELSAQTDDLKKRASEAAGKLATVQGQLDTSRKAITQARKASTQAQKEAAQASKNAAAATKRQQEAVKNEQTARGNLKKVSGQLGATQKQRATAVQQLSAAKSELSKANAAVQSANVRVQSANARVNAATAKVAKAEAKLATVQNSLIQAQTNATQAETRAQRAKRSAIQSGKAAIQSGKAAIQSGKAAIDAGKQVIIARDKVTTLTAQSEKLQRDNDGLNRINARLGDDNKKIRDTNMVLSLSDVRVPVDSTLVEHSFARSTAALDVRDELRAMFNRSADKIVPGLLPNAELKLADLPSLDGKSLLTTDEIYDNLVNYIANSPTALSVRLVAARNHLAGESVLESRFLVLPIRPAFPDNFELARVDLDGRTGEGPLFSALLDLVDKGTAVAKSKGVRPPLSPDVPNFYVPGSREQIFDALRQIKAINGPALVHIVTDKAISTADQLSVKFVVEPINPDIPQTTTTATARMASPK